MLKDLEDLIKTIRDRKNSPIDKSYTNKLLQLGPNKIAQKFGEESTELIIDYLKGSKKRTIEEAADVIYHLIVLLKSKKITLNEINKELEKRKTNVR